MAYRNKASLLQLQGQLEAALDHYEQALSSFRISTEGFVDAARDLEDLRAAEHDERAATDLLYTSSVVSTIESVVALRTQLGRPLTQALSARTAAADRRPCQWPTDYPWNCSGGRSPLLT
jgi:hypothetical protein